MSCFTYSTAQVPGQGTAVHSSVGGRLALELSAGKDRPAVGRLVEEPVVGRLVEEPVAGRLVEEPVVGRLAQERFEKGRAAELDRPAVEGRQVAVEGR